MNPRRFTSPFRVVCLILLLKPFTSLCLQTSAMAPDGTFLGRFDLGTATGNCAWGEDGSTLFITSNTRVYRIRLKTHGVSTTVQGFRRLGDVKVFTFTNERDGGAQ